MVHNLINKTTTLTRPSVNCVRAGGVASGTEDGKDLRTVIKRKPCRTTSTIKMGTWNVRTMRRIGKLENIKKEMERNQINILGLSEVRWKEGGECECDGYRVIYAGGGESQRGVGVILDRETSQRVTEVVRQSDRLMLVRVQAEPVDMIILQVYMPTSQHREEEVDEMYEIIEEMIEKQKGNEYVVVMGDFNAVVGEGCDGKEVGKYGLGVRNERGEKLVDFCKRNKLTITNTCFQHERRRRYTWTSPGNTGRYQIDYIMVPQRYRNSVKNSCSYPGADADSDHNLVLMRARVNFKKISRGNMKRKWNKENLKTGGEIFQREIEETVMSWTKKDVSMDDRWKALKTAIKESAERNIGYQKKEYPRKPWITSIMIEKMNERRNFKNARTEEGRKSYRRLNNELRRLTDKAREEWWSRECEELEEFDKRGRSDLMYNKVKNLTGQHGRCCVKSGGIKDESGRLIRDPEQIREGWKRYVETLYDKDNKPSEADMKLESEQEIDTNSLGPELMKSEILEAIQYMKNNRTEGIDGLPAEFFKQLGRGAMGEVIAMCNEIYDKGNWPKEFAEVIMLPIPKKVNAVECSDFRTISLIPHASKIMLRIIKRRIEGKAREAISKTQFGFRKGMGTREAIGVVRMLCERSMDYGNSVYVCFIDFEKAFDRVNWVKMMNILLRLGVDWRDRRLIRNLYMNQEAVVKVDSHFSEPGQIGRGVRQGCLMSPLLFSLYVEAMMEDAMKEVEEGVQVGGYWLKDIRFADDQGMVASTEQGLQKIIDRLNEEAKRYDMKINVKKTKVMKISKLEGQLKIVIDGQVVQQVNKFKYLGAWITEDGRCDTEIRTRIAMAKEAFSKRKDLLTKGIRISTKKRIVKTLIWSVALYCAETWTLRKEDIRRLESFEMWIWRKMEKISWRAKMTNEEVLRRVGEQRSFVNCIFRRKKNWIGHVVRGEGLLKEVIEARMTGKRGPGRIRKGMLDELKNKETYGAMKRRAEDRSGWRSWSPWTCPTAEN